MIQQVPSLVSPVNHHTGHLVVMQLEEKLWSLRGQVVANHCHEARQIGKRGGPKRQPNCWLVRAFVWRGDARNVVGRHRKVGMSDSSRARVDVTRQTYSAVRLPKADLFHPLRYLQPRVPFSKVTMRKTCQPQFALTRSGQSVMTSLQNAMSCCAFHARAGCCTTQTHLFSKNDLAWLPELVQPFIGPFVPCGDGNMDRNLLSILNILSPVSTCICSRLSGPQCLLTDSHLPNTRYCLGSKCM